MDRRALMTTATAGLVALAGCAGGGDRSGGGNETAAQLDLQEANVTGVDVGSTDDGTEFSVTLFHDDEGEDGYADWWQVETLDGTRLGRRELTHPHGTKEFTRSATVQVPPETSCVVVRGHDQTHGYGGQAMAVDVEGGTTTAVQQGTEPKAIVSCDGATRTMTTTPE